MTTDGSSRLTQAPCPRCGQMTDAPGPCTDCLAGREPWTAADVGGRVTVVEYGDDRQPKPHGMRFRGRVESVTGIYVIIVYDDAHLTETGKDQFYASSGWRSWDGELRWRLTRKGGRR
jgi:hypothetical protein